MTALPQSLPRFGTFALLIAASCSSTGEQRVAVEPFSVEIAEDGTTVTVAVSWPVDGVAGCPPKPAGLDVDVTGDVGRVAVFVSAAGTGSSCQAECGGLLQTVTLDEPVGAILRWEWPPEALTGCSPSPLR